MKNFPDFMKVTLNCIDSSKQNTNDVEGYYYTANDGSQMAFWTCYEDRISVPHRHDFDEYMICVSGQYKAILDGKEVLLNPGDELHIPKGVLQAGSCKAGTRTIHAFGGKRIE
jgi:quercetin dioxygenase-like cupin family protein